jgi:hypothetical protein
MTAHCEVNSMQKILKQTAEKIHKNVTAYSTLYIGDYNSNKRKGTSRAAEL